MCRAREDPCLASYPVQSTSEHAARGSGWLWAQQLSWGSAQLTFSQRAAPAGILSRAGGGAWEERGGEPCGSEAVLVSRCSLLCRTAVLLVTVNLSLRCVGDETWGTRDHCFRAVGFGQPAVPLWVLSVPLVPWFVFIYLRADLPLACLGLVTR